MLSSIACLVMSITVMFGWITNIEMLKTFLPGLVPTEFNLAFSVALVSLVLILKYFFPENTRMQWVASALSIVVIMIATCTLVEYLLQVQLGIDELFVKDNTIIYSKYYPGRMSPISALCLLVFAAITYVLHQRKYTVYQFHLLSAIAFLSLVMLIGLVFITDIPAYIHMAIPECLSFIILSTAFWAIQPELHKKISFERKTFAALGAAMLLVIFISTLSVYYSNMRNITAAKIEATNKIQEEAEKTLSLAEDIETSGLAYVLTSDTSSLRYYDNARDKINIQIARLWSVSSGSDSERVWVDSLHFYVNKQIGIFQAGIAQRMKANQRLKDYPFNSGAGIYYTNWIRETISQLQQREDRLLSEQLNSNQKNIASFNRAFFVFLSSVMLMLLVIIFTFRANNIERRKAEKSASESEEQVQIIFDSAPDAVIVFDGSGKIIQWNPKAVKLFGWETAEVVGQSILSLIVPEKYQDPYLLIWDKITADPDIRLQGHDTEIKVNTRAGAIIDIAISISEASFKNEQIFIGFIRDISEKLAVQQLLESLSRQIDKANDAIISIDANNKIISWNDGAEKLYGFGKEEMLGHEMDQVLKTDSSDDSIKNISYELQEHDYWAGELRRKTKSGKLINIHSSKTTIRDSDGEIQGFVAVSYDISYQKKLTAEVNHLANIVAQTTEAIISVGLDLRIISWNKGAENIFGYSQEEVIGKVATDLELFSMPENEINDSYEALLKNLSWKAELPAMHKDGHKFFGIINATVIKNELGDTESIVLIINDITERIKLEQELKQYSDDLEEKVRVRTMEIERNEKKYRNIFENSPLPMWISDNITLAFLDVNDMALMKYGYTREEFLTMTAADIRPAEERQKFLHQNLSYDLDIENSNRGIWNHLKKDGTLMKMEVIVHKIMFDEMPCRMVLANDVTDKILAEQKMIASEKQFRNTIDNMLEGAQIIGYDWKYIYVNDSFLKQTEFHKHELLGYSLIEKFPGIEDAEIFQDYQRCMNERMVIHKETEFQFPDKQNSWLELRFQPVPEGIFILSVDITARKRAQFEIEKLNQELEQKVANRTDQLVAANKEMESFSYSVSHDLRAPLRGIIGFANILEEDFGPQMTMEALRILTVIKDNTSRMGQLIDDLLMFSRMGRNEIVKNTINTRSMVSAIIESVNNMEGQAPIKWNVHDLPNIEGDQSMINQVWVNLIANAVKYSKQNPNPCIEIGSLVHEGQIGFFVKDNGVGFDIKYVDKLFRVFQRLHSSHEFEGTGIGLAIVEKIVTKHGGRVWASASLNKGATFFFSLPPARNQIKSTSIMENVNQSR